MRYRRTATRFVGFEGTDWLCGVKQESIPALDNGFFFDVKEEGGNALVIGEMTAKKGSGNALFVCAADDPYDQLSGECTVTFRAAGDTVKAYNGKGIVPVIRMADGSYAVTIDVNDAVLIEAN